MAKRFKDALQIAQGAGNMVAIARSLHEACKECMYEGLGTEQVWADPAVRLIVHQMAHLTNQHEISSSLLAFSALEDQCRQRSMKGETA